MRRLIAALSLFSLANLMFAQGGAECPLRGHHAESAATSTMSGHEGHDMGATANHDMAQPAPDDDASHVPACLTMGPCALTLDFTGAVVVTHLTMGTGHVIAVSDHLPPSATLSPELPPPRA